MPGHGWRSASSVQERASPDGTITTRSRHARAVVRADMPGTLYIVATPIGNLEDITLRALRVLRDVDVIAAEDTRAAQHLLSHHGISGARVVSYFEGNEARRSESLVEDLLAGKNVALISEAGTPAVSDPGSRVVAAAISAGVRVEPIPGASAAISALVASGLPSDRFL